MNNFICEYCNCEHDGNYGSGRFCTRECMYKFVLSKRRKHLSPEIMKKILDKSLKARSNRRYLWLLDVLNGNILDARKGFSFKKLKLSLIEFGFKDYKCEICGNTTWFENKIPLEVHHIDGNDMNNCIENIQLLCPNCHTQTDNYRAKNRKNFKSKNNI